MGFFKRDEFKRSAHGALLLLACAGACGGSAPEAASVAAAGGETAEAEPVLPKQLAAFDYVWEAIDRTHWDPEKVGESWDAARAELRPKVAAAQTSEEAGRLIGELIASLGQSHFAVTGGGPASADVGGSGSMGIDVRLIDDAVVVWRVAKDGPAFAKGIRTGMIIEAVNGRPWSEVLAKVRAAAKSGTQASEPGSPHSVYEEGSTAGAFVRGVVGEVATLSILDGKGAKSEVAVTWAKAPGTLASFGLLREIPVEYESEEIGKSIGYVRLSMFFDPMTVSQRFKSDIERFSGKSGLVFDLRGNPGGIGGMAMGLGGRLVSEKGSKLGTMISRDSRLDFVLNPQPGSFTGKLAILVDGQCASTCEILAAGLEDIGRATVFGTRTAGAALPSQIEQLPNGSLFQYATANYVSASGRALEHDGLQPSQNVPLTRESLLAGSDSQLAAAISWIESQ